MSRKPDQELVARPEAKGYQRWAHKEKDKVRNRHNHVDKTKKDHDGRWTATCCEGEPLCHAGREPVLT
jgi:hypothetical protein